MCICESHYFQKQNKIKQKTKAKQNKTQISPFPDQEYRELDSRPTESTAGTYRERLQREVREFRED